MKAWLMGLAVLPLCFGAAAANDRLSDAQMDLVTAGALTLPVLNCAGCISASSGQTASSVNGVTVVTITGGSPSNSSSGSSSSSGGGSSSGSGGSSGNGGTVFSAITGLPPSSSAGVFGSGGSLGLLKP